MLLSFIGKARAAMSTSQPTRYVAIDMDSRHLRLVHAVMRRGLPKFKKLVSVDVPADLNMTDSKAVGEFIDRSLRQYGLQGHRILMDVPRSEAILKPLTLPFVENDRELPGMVRFQVEKELPFPMEEAVVDFTRDRFAGAPGGNGNGSGNGHGKVREEAAGGKGGTDGEDEGTSEETHVLVAAVRRSVIEHHENIAEAAGFKLHQLGMRPYADMCCLSACLSQEDRAEAHALVHVNSDEAEINVIVNGSLSFSRAAVVKMPHDGNEHEGPRSMEDCISALSVEVVRSLQTAQAQQADARIAKIYFAGDTGLERSVSEKVAERLGRPCVMLEPIQALKIKNAGGSHGGGFISAIGLLVGQNQRGEMPLDFLNPKEPPVERDMTRVRNSALVAAAVILGVGGMVYGVAQVSSEGKTVSTLRAKLNGLKKKEKPVAAIAKRDAYIQSWVDGERDWLKHVAHINSLFPPADQIHISSLKTGRMNTKVPGSKKQIPHRTLVYIVKAKTARILTDLERRLDAEGYLVKFGTETTKSDELGYNVSNTLTVNVPTDMKIDPNLLVQVGRPDKDGSIIWIKNGKKFPGSRSNYRSSRSRGRSR